MPHSEPQILRFPSPQVDEDPVVITGVGLCASVGKSREEVWKAVQEGRSGVRLTNKNDPVAGLELPCAMIDWTTPKANELKSIQLTRLVAAEALQDASVNWSEIDRVHSVHPSPIFLPQKGLIAGVFHFDATLI